MFFKEGEKTKFGLNSSTDDSSGNQPSVQAWMEAAKWKAKYEIIKEMFTQERKDRKTLETNLNKLAYELGGVKNEVRQLENRLRLLTGQSEKKEEPAVKPEESRRTVMPEMQYQPAQSADEFFAPEPEKAKSASRRTAAEPPKLFVKFADVKNLETPEPEPVSQPQIEVMFSHPRIEMEPVDIEPVLAQAPAEEEQNDIMVALETSFKSEAAETWGYASSLMDHLKRWPQKLCEEKFFNQETREGIYYDFSKRLQKLSADYNNYRHLMPVIHSEMVNLEKVIPYVDYTLKDLEGEA